MPHRDVRWVGTHAGGGYELLRQRVPARSHTIVVIGKVTSDRPGAAIDKSFGAGAPAATRPHRPAGLCLPTDRPRSAVPAASRVQDRGVLAQTLALTRSDPDYYALPLGHAVLGGSCPIQRGSASMVF